MIIQGDVDQVWQELLGRLLNDGIQRFPRDLRTKELLAVQVRIDMKQPLLAVKSRALGYRFACAEAAWILTGDNRLSTIQPYAKAMAGFSDDGMTLAGAYGPPLRDQLPYVIKALVDDPGTRQAVVTLWRPRPGPSKDIPCTVSLQWLKRAEKLHCVATMRSSDAWLGLPYDVFTFSCISAYVAGAVGNIHRDLGYLYLTMGSSHLYERDWQVARTAINDQAKAFIGNISLELTDYRMITDNLTKHLWHLARGEWDQLPNDGWLVPELKAMAAARSIKVTNLSRSDAEESYGGTD